MSQENVEIIRRGYEALNRRDVDTWLSGFHADAEVHDLPTIPDAPVYGGHYALRNWVEMIRDVWTEESYYELEKLTAAGDFVLVAVRGHAWGRGSGVPIEVSFFQVFEMRDGKVQRAWAYLTRTKPSKPPGCGRRVAKVRPARALTRS